MLKPFPLAEALKLLREWVLGGFVQWRWNGGSVGRDLRTFKEMKEGFEYYLGALFYNWNEKDAETYRAKGTKALDYIEELAGKTQTDISDWDLVQVFREAESGGGGDCKIPLKRNEINKHFFIEVARRKKLEEKGPSVFTEEVTKNLVSNFEKTRKANGEDSQHFIAGLSADLENLRRRTIQKTDALIKVLQAQAFLESNQVPDVTGELMRALEEGFFKLRVIYKDRAELVTNADIILTQRNEQAGVDLRVNMGRFKILLFFSGLGVSVYPFKGNVKSRGYWHPYVGGDGQVCWGEALDTIQMACLKWDFDTILKTLAQILSVYNPEATPYQSLYAFDVALRNPPGEEAGSITASAETPSNQAFTLNATQNRDGSVLRHQDQILNPRRGSQAEGLYHLPDRDGVQTLEERMIRQLTQEEHAAMHEQAQRAAAMMDQAAVNVLHGRPLTPEDVTEDNEPF